MFYLESWGQRFERVHWHLVPVGGTDCQRFLENVMRLRTLGLLEASSAAGLSPTSCWSSFLTDVASLTATHTSLQGSRENKLVSALKIIATFVSFLTAHSEPQGP